jgi:hypothetical protein
MTTDKLQNLDTEYDQVFFIDCLPEDEYNNWKISQDLMKYLADNGVVQTSSICRTKKLVIATLHHLHKIANGGTKFCLHIVSHGDKTGLWVKSTEEDIYWEDFTKLLERINQAMGGTLMVNMTSCLGLHGIKMVDESSEHYPFFGLVGYSDDLEVDKGKEINKQFYKKIMEGKEVQEAVTELRNELNDDKLYCMSSQGFKIIKNKLSRHD